MRNITWLFIVCLSLSLTACNDSGGGSGGGGSSQAALTSPADVVPDTGADSGGQTTPPVTNPNVSVTYYTLSKTVAPVNGWITKTYTARGICTIYNAVTYCWDDGLITMDGWEFNNFDYPATYNPYWGYMTSTAGNAQSCTNGCTSDYFDSPVKVTTTVMNKLTSTAINTVINTGAATQVSCEDTGTQLNCGSFVIDL